MSAVTVGVLLAAGLVLGIGVPWVGIRMLWPSLSSLTATVNYRGRPVHAGLGIVWLLWAGSAILAGGFVTSVAGDEGSRLGVLMLAGPLALVAFALGLVDDAYGSAGAKGFRGHLSALGRGHLTTGGMKLVGVSLASLVVAAVLGQLAPWGLGGLDDGTPTVGYLASALAAGAAIALTSNFVNLTDVRPGRALKVYSVLATVGVASTMLGLAWPASGYSLDSWAVVDAAAFVLLVLGPVLAVWRFDLGEVGMLGDAGANPMGAVAGMLIVAGLSLPALLGYLALMLGLNAASERISFSRVVERTRPLRWLDGLGRLPQEAEIHRPE